MEVGDFFWEICWDTGLTTRASGSINADAYQSGRSSRAVKLGKLSTTNLDERLHVIGLGVILYLSFNGE